MRPFGALRRDERGVAAIEAAFVGSLLVGALMNVVEVSRYAYVTAQVAAATQAGAQAAAMTCDTTKAPATTKCAGLQTAVDTAIQGTSLGEAVALDGALQEGWYCVTAQGALHYESAAGSPPSTCSDIAVTDSKPGLYLRVRTKYTYQPIFPGLTIAATFADEINRTAWMRML